MRWPGKSETGKVISEIAGVLDIYPTLADICNIPYPENQKPLDGRSLYPLLKGENSYWSEKMYFDNTNLYQIEETRFNVDSPCIREKSVQFKNFKYIKRDNYLNGLNKLNPMADNNETGKLCSKINSNFVFFKYPF
jgi:arylsulfatase A-like enzyme